MATTDPSKPVKRTWWIEAAPLEAAERIAQQSNTTVTKVVNEALKYYADKYYLEHEATMLPQEITDALRSTTALLEHRINNRSNQLISSLCIQQFIMAKVLADSLELSPDALELYRTQAVEFLRENNRVLNLKEVIE